MRRWITAYAVGCCGLIALVSFILWAANDFRGLGIGWHGMIAVLIGSAFVTALSIGLMAAVFWSHRAGHDEAAHRTHRDNRVE